MTDFLNIDTDDKQPLDETAATVFLEADGETDKTDETDSSQGAEVVDASLSISNTDFLTAIFGELTGEARPVVTGFAGHPGKASGSKWSGRVWVPGKTAIDDPLLNWYGTTATYVPDADGKYRRKKSQFVALHAVMLDDVGTKAEGRDRLAALPPSWEIETSDGNFQVGYIFKEPVSDRAAAEGLLKGLIAAGLCDPGADGPLARYVRLPVAVNGKHAPPFACKLVEWHPERRYSVEEIGAALELDLNPPVARNPGARRRTTVAHDMEELDEERVYMPRSGENEVIAALRQRGLYKSPLGSGKHDITCPWKSEHTDGVDGGSAYFEPDDSFPIGGFKCHHGHCAHRRIGALLDHLGVSRQAARDKPKIKTIAGEIHRIVDATEQELAKSGKYYQRGGLLVTVVTDPGNGSTMIKELSQPGLLRAMSAAVLFERYDGRQKEWVVTDPPARHVAVLFDSDHYPHMPVLAGIARQPYLRQDGTLMMQAGYDPYSGMFGAFDERLFHVSAQPSRSDALAALAEIQGLLDEFAFACDADESAAMSGILTAAIRPSLPQAPMYHVRAPQIASGKSYLSAVISAFATPEQASAMSYPEDDEECRKLLLAALMAGAAVLSFDNLTSDLVPHKSLCSVLTEPFLTGRILGVSKTATVATRALFMSSGNNVGPIQDMARRTITINLDPKCETPAARTFAGSPLREVRSRREYFVSLALTIIRAWIAAGRPLTTVKSIASYEEWSEYVRQPLLWLGQPDPANSIFKGLNADPERESLGRVLSGWHKAFGNAPKMVRDVVAAITAFPLSADRAALKEAIDEVAEERGQVNRRRLGRWLARHQGRIVDGLRLEKVDGARNADQWRVVSVSSV